MSIQLHSPFARALYAKLRHIQEHAESAHEFWYDIRKEFLISELLDCFIQSRQDYETTEFLHNCFERSDWLFTQLYHSISQYFLTLFMTATSANGLLKRGSMFVFSKEQFRTLLNVDKSWRCQRLLDLGAGDGNVTQKMADHFNEVFVTEISPVMRWRLRQAKYTVIDVEEWDRSYPTIETGGSASVVYDVISCLNLLDRCDAPYTLLTRVHRVLNPDRGLFLLAVVLPLKQSVETAPDRRPSELLEVSPSPYWEEELSSLVTGVLHSVGFDLVRWTRLPYLCQGDFSCSFYTLNNVVMVLKPRCFTYDFPNQ